MSSPVCLTCTWKGATLRKILPGRETVILPTSGSGARRTLAAHAGADIARLVFSSRDPGWKDIPDEVSGALERAGQAAERGDLPEAEAELTRAREALGGPSR